MPRYRVTIHVDEYWDYIVEGDDEDDVMRGANNRWWEGIDDDIWPDIVIKQVEDDTPLGDVG